MAICQIYYHFSAFIASKTAFPHAMTTVQKYTIFKISSPHFASFSSLFHKTNNVPRPRRRPDVEGTSSRETEHDCEYTIFKNYLSPITSKNIKRKDKYIAVSKTNQSRRMSETDFHESSFVGKGIEITLFPSLASYRSCRHEGYRADRFG